jgi:hypothetical protein
VLDNWAETPFFLQLQHQLDSSEDMSRTVFQDKTEELTYFKQEMITEIVHSIFYAIKARSLKYRSEVRDHRYRYRYLMTRLSLQVVYL